jgi:hypothetical protein
MGNDSPENLNERDQFKNLDIDWRIILKLTFNKLGLDWI